MIPGPQQPGLKIRRHTRGGGGETYFQVAAQDLKIPLPSLEEELTEFGATRDIRVLEIAT
jgi:hypothetical protein